MGWAAGFSAGTSRRASDRQHEIEQEKLRELVRQAQMKEMESGFRRTDAGAIEPDPDFYTAGTPSFQRGDREAALKAASSAQKGAGALLTADQYNRIKSGLAKGQLDEDLKTLPLSPSYGFGSQSRPTSGTTAKFLRSQGYEIASDIPDDYVVPTGALQYVNPDMAPGALKLADRNLKDDLSRETLRSREQLTRETIKSREQLAREAMELKKQLAQEARKASASKAGKKRDLLPNELLKVEAGSEAFKTAADLDALLKNNRDLFGPVAGRAGSWNPWNTQAQSVEAELGTAAQIIGTFLEGGVLREGDVVKYKRMLPQLSDNPVVAERKMQAIKKRLSDKARGQREVLARGGYDTSAFDQIPVEQFSPTREGAPPPAGGQIGAIVRGAGEEIPRAVRGGGNVGEQKSVVKKQFSPSRNQTKITYSDGSEEVVSGKK